MRIDKIIEGMFLFITSMVGYVYGPHILSSMQNVITAYGSSVLPSTVSAVQTAQILQLQPDFVALMVPITQLFLFGLILISTGLMIYGALSRKPSKHLVQNN